jgi:hypothetical protein
LIEWLDFVAASEHDFNDQCVQEQLQCDSRAISRGSRGLKNPYATSQNTSCKRVGILPNKLCYEHGCISTWTFAVQMACLSITIFILHNGVYSGAILPLVWRQGVLRSHAVWWCHGRCKCCLLMEDSAPYFLFQYRSVRLYCNSDMMLSHTVPSGQYTTRDVTSVRAFCSVDHEPNNEDELGWWTMVAIMHKTTLWRQDLKNEEKVKHSYSNFCFSGIEQLSQEVTWLNMCWMGIWFQTYMDYVVEGLKWELSFEWNLPGRKVNINDFVLHEIVPTTSTGYRKVVPIPRDRNLEFLTQRVALFCSKFYICERIYTQSRIYPWKGSVNDGN